MANIKLTDEDIQGIRYARSEGATYGELAKIYGVSRTQIYRIVKFLQRAVPQKRKPTER